MKDQSKELEHLLEELNPQDVIYTTSKGNDYHFVAYKNDSLVFDIPNHNNPAKPYKKAVTKNQFCELLSILQQNKKLESDDFPFKDCRKAAFYGFVNIIYPDQYVKRDGGIFLS